jgi:hypothetical protein
MIRHAGSVGHVRFLRLVLARPAHVQVIANPNAPGVASALAWASCLR